MQRPNKKCIYCSNIFVKRKNLGKAVWELQKFCSLKCSSKSQKGVTKLKHTEEFKKQTSLRHKGKVNSVETKKKMSDTKKGVLNPNFNKKFSSETYLKMSISKRGDKHYAWKGGISVINDKIRRLYEYRLWRSDVFKRDNFTCVICEQIGKNLNADHFPDPFSYLIKYNKITSVKEAIECSKLWDLNNGRTLCLKCHKKTNTYGAKALKYKTGLANPQY